VRKLRHAEIDRIPHEKLAEVDRHPLTVVIENVRSAYNVGSILRTCDAALVERVIVTGYTPKPDHRKVRKTALGAESGIEWEDSVDTLPVLRRLRAEGHAIAILEITDTPSRISELEVRHFPLALVVGNEVTGITDEVVEEADLALEIPQYGAKQSLNVAVAFGVAAIGIVERFHQLR
jgi:tRNA G18 (ribose-2'-O)-methylase SpoU